MGGGLRWLSQINSEFPKSSHVLFSLKIPTGERWKPFSHQSCVFPLRILTHSLVRRSTRVVDMPMISVLFTPDGEPAHTHVLWSPASSELSDKITRRLLTYTTCDPHLSGLRGVLGWSQHQKYNPCLLVLQAPFPGSSALPVFIFSSLSGVVTASSFVFVPVEATAAYSRKRF